MTNDVIVGTYTGNGATQSIIIGEQPKLLIVMKNIGGNQANMAIKTIDMPGELFFQIGGAVEVFSIDGLAITVNGFNVGDRISINKNNNSFVYMVWI